MTDGVDWEDLLRAAAGRATVPGDTTTAAGPDLGPASSAPLPGTPATDPARLLAALAVLLQRYTGESGLLLGLQQAERPDLIVPVPLDATPAGPVAGLLDAARHGTAGPAVPVTLLAERRGTGAGGPAACHAVVVLGAAEAAGDTPAELAVTVPAGGPVVLHVSARRFGAATAARLARHLAVALAALTGADDGAAVDGAAVDGAAVDDVALLDDEDLHRALTEWNDTDATLPEGYFHELVAAVAARTPDAPAVVEPAGTTSFGQLDDLAARLAGHLAGLGATAGGRVAVCLERSAASLIAQLAAFKLGAAAVLMDPEYPAERLAFMVEHAGVAAVVTRTDLARALFADAAAPLVCLDTPSWRSAEPYPARPGVLTDESVSHVAYTSGSTGVPKAVQLRQGPLRQLIHTLTEQCGITAADRGSWLSSPGFGLVEVDCMPVLAAGAPVHIPPATVAASATELRDWLVANRISQALLLTAMAERTWLLPWPAGTALRSMRIAGERLRTWPPVTLPFGVVNVYGSAEATVVATTDVVEVARALSDEERAGRMPPIGRPVGNVRTYVLDRALRPAPPGVAGELYVSGASLSKGYLNRPDATESKFLANTIPGDPHPVLYRTGDVARYWPDGMIEIVGRTDHEVKIRGYRVHLGEVESAITAQAGVRQAAVLAREDGNGERRLVAYVEPDPSDPISVPALRQALARTLPEYARPSAYVVAELLPTTANGKIDRASLPAPARSRPDLGTAFCAPRDETERRLAVIWAQVLDLDEIGVFDDFFQLGGDSMRAMRLLTAVEESLGAPLSLSALYESPTVAAVAPAVATAIAETGDDGTDLPIVAGDPEHRWDPFPLTPNQQALWIGRGDAVDMGNVGAHGYFEWEQVGLDAGRFRGAWRRLLDRHDMLRTVIRPDGTQIVLRDLDGDGITVTDLRDLPAAAAEEAAGRIREEMSHQVIPADRWPLYDVRVTLLPDGRGRLHFGLDMLIMDAWSAFQVLFPELMELYDTPSADLPEIGVTFRDYVVTMAEGLPATRAYRRSAAYWAERLPDLPPAPDLPQVHQPTGEITFDRREAAVPVDRWSRLKDRANREGLTHNGILVAVFAETLRAWSRNDRFTINFPIFDRLPLHDGIDAVLGDFTNTILVAAERTDGSFLDRARDLQGQLWRDLEHRFVNGVSLLRDLARRSGGALRPAMPIVLTSLLGHPPRRQVSGLGRETYGISQTPQVLLDFQIREIDGVLHFKWDFLAALFPAGLIDAMFEAYCSLVDRLVDDETVWAEERPVGLPEPQRRRRALVNDTAVDVPERTLSSLLDEQAATRPDAVAVVDGDHRVTYADLRRHANRVGHRLRALGVTADAPVAVVMAKGWEQYAAVYGALAAGAGYLPVDVTVPAERQRRLLAAAGATVVLTQSGLVPALGLPDSVRVIAVDTDLGAEPDTALDPVGSPDDLAYVIYTSGSTGEPKGVAVSQRSVVNHVLDVNSRFGLGPDDRALATAGLHFDMSVFDVFGMIAAGGTVVLPRVDGAPDPARWAGLVAAEGVTFWGCVPQLMDMAVEWCAAHDSPALRTLRRVVLAGDWIPVTLPDRMRALAPRVAITSCGGPTETVNWSIAYEIGAVDPDWVSIPYGFPMANQQYHVLDAALADRPDWVPGEMYVTSEVGLARGYWRDPVRTAERFRELPDGRRAYATGDIGRYRPDGSIEILGRDDFQVKVQGHRIELGEIEANLAQYPGVTGAVVVAPPGPDGRRHLTGFVQADPDGPAVTTGDLTGHLRGRLPGYLVPADLRLIDAFPLSGNGKIDRRALESLAGATGGDTGAAPAEPLEQVLGDLFAETLGRPAIGRDDNFFTAGGDSLSGIRLATRIADAFGVDVPLRMIFALPTVAQLYAGLLADPELGPAVHDLAAAFAGLAEDVDDGLGLTATADGGR